jgi:hypothetical protein
MSFHTRRPRLRLEELETRLAPAASVSPTGVNPGGPALIAPTVADVPTVSVQQLAFSVAPPASVAAGSPFAVTVQAQDSMGDLLANYTGPVTLALAGNPGSASLSGALTVNAVNGVASFSNLLIDTAGVGYVLQASSAGVTASSAGLTVTPAGPAQLVLGGEPPASLTAGAAFGLTVQAVDAFGNVETDYNGPVSVALAANPGNVALQGTTTLNAVNGVATFSGLSVDTTGSGYGLQASLGNLTAVDSGISVTPAAASQLVFAMPTPSTLAANEPFSLTVNAEDAYGNTATDFTGPVTLSLAANAGGATLGGTLTLNAVDGSAAFNGLTLDTPGSGYTLQANAGALPAVTTPAVTVTPAVPTQLVVTAPPPASVAAGQTFGLTVDVEDAYGNPVGGYTGPVSLALVGNPASTPLSGALTVDAVNGVAAFTGLSLSAAETGIILQATAGGLTVTTGGLSVTAGPDAQLALAGGPGASVTAGGAFGLSVSVEDGLGNVDPSYTGPVTLSLAGGPAGSRLQGQTTVNAVAGVATFAGLSVDAAGSGYTLQASAGSLAADSGSFSVTPAAATQLVLPLWPGPVLTAGSGIGLSVSAEDAFGNVVTGFTAPVALSLKGGPAGASLLGTTTVNAVAGVAKFTGLSVDAPGTGYSLQAVSGSLKGTGAGFSIVPGPVAKLAFTTPPPASVAAGAPFAVTVSADDAFGNPTGAGTVTLSLSGGPAGASLQGHLTAAVVNGVATFTGLSLPEAGSGYVLHASMGGLTVQSGGVLVTPGQAVQLALTSPPPASVTAGGAFGLTVTAKDAEGNVASNYTGPVSLSLASDPGNTLLLGKLTVNAVAGVATFTGLSLGVPASGYVLQATLPGASVKTGSITVTAGAPAKVVVAAPATVTAGSTFDVTATVEDAQGNVETSYNGNVLLFPLSAPPGVAESAIIVPVHAVNGVATFTESLTSAGNYSLQVGVGVATGSAHFTVTPAAATHLAFVGGPMSSVGVGAAFGVTVAVEDAFGNVATGYSGNVTLALVGGAGVSLAGSASAKVANGLAAFTGLSLTGPGTNLGLVASSGSLAKATTSVTAYPLVAITTAPPATVQAGSSFGLTVTVEDSSGHAVAGYNGPVSVTLLGGVALLGKTTVTAHAGVAVFTGLSIYDAGSNYKLLATAGSGNASAASARVTVTPAPVSRLVLLTTPATTQAAGSRFGLSVAAEDAFGNVITDYTGPVTLSLLGGPAHAGMKGVLTVTPHAGVAVFTGLSLDQAGSGYSVKASSGKLTAAATGGMTVTPGAPAALVLTPASLSETANVSFGLGVKVEDAWGNVETGFNGAVRLSAPGNALHGTLTATAHAGQASFAGLSFSTAGTTEVDAAADGLTGKAVASVAPAVPVVAEVYQYQYSVFAYDAKGHVLATGTFYTQAKTTQQAAAYIAADLSSWGQQLRTVSHVNWSSLGDALVSKSLA